MATTYQGQKFRFNANAELGGGGMARVYLGEQDGDPNKLVAVKTPLDSLAEGDRDLFLREAEAAMKVADPRIVSVIDWGSDPKPFIAFEYIVGGTLEKEITRRQSGAAPWPEADLIAVYSQLAAAMNAINKEVIHRDLKPANIFYQDGQIKIGDFGISKYVGQVTRSRSFKGWGSLPYQAPETLKQDSADWRSDQYSLGIVMYEMAALKRPFVGNEQELVNQQLYARPARLNEIAQVSVRLAAIIAKMLEKRVDDRYQSWDVLEKDLEALAQAPRAEGGVAAPTDPLLAAALAQVEIVRSRNLERERADAEQVAKRNERKELVLFWTTELFGRLRTRLEALRTVAPTIEMQESPAKPGDARAFGAKFLQSTLSVDLQAVPHEGGDEVLAWGIIKVATPKQFWAANLAVLPSPPPYGKLVLVEMETHPMIPTRPSDPYNGKYWHVGNLIIAQSWGALVHQRRQKGVMSAVQYKERVPDLATLWDEPLKTFINNASSP